jgi:hypothetical protein
MHATATIRRLAATAIALGAIAAPVAGQQGTSELPSARIPGWSFTPSLSGGMIYDSNVALSAPQANQVRTDGDAFYNIVPSGDLDYLGRRTEFSLGYRGFVRRYMDVDGLNGFDQRATLGFKRAVSKRLTFFARNNFADSPTTDEVEVNGVPFRRTGSRTNTFAANADWRISKRMSLATRYDMTWVAFDRTDQFLTGGTIHGIRSDLSRQLTDRIAISGEYSFRTATLDEGERDFRFQNAGAGVTFTLGPHTTAHAATGLAVLHDRTVDETRSGPFARVSITHALEAATVGASFERQYVPSFGFGGSSSSQETRGFVMMPFGRQRMYVQGSAAWRRTMPFEANVLELDTIWLRSTVGYAAARWARLEALYTYTRQDSIITGGEIDRHRVGLQFVISQPMRIH